MAIASNVSVPTSLLRPVRDGNAFETAVERLVRTIKLGVIRMVKLTRERPTPAGLKASTRSGTEP